jgi:DNA-binding PadR family transcriptional regulator
LRQEDQTHITEEGLEELKEFAEKIDQEREKTS